MKTELRMGPNNQKSITKYGIIWMVIGFIVVFASCQQKPEPTVDQQNQLPQENDIEAHNYDDFNHPYLAKAQEIKDKEGIGAAIEFYEAALSLFEKEKNWVGYGIAADKLIINYNSSSQRKKQFHKIQDVLNKTIRYLDDNNLDKSSVSADIFEAYGYYYYTDFQADSALFWYNKCLTLRDQIYQSEDVKKMADIYYRLGMLYRWRLDDNFNAEQCFSKELKIRENLDEVPGKDFTHCYYNLAVTNRYLKNYDKALLYANKTLDFIQRVDTANYELKQRCFNNLGNLYYQRGEFENAIDIYKKAINFIEQDGSASPLPNYYNNLGLAYTALGQQKTAIDYHHKALNIYKNTKHKRGLAQTYDKLKAAYSELKLIDSADYYCDLFLNTTISFFGPKHITTAKSYVEYGNHQKKWNRALPAIEAAQKSLIAGLNDYNQDDVTFNPDLSLLKNNYYLISGLRLKAELLKNNPGLKGLDEEERLKLALDAYLLADSLINMQRKSIIIEESKLYLAKDYKEIYEQSIDCAYQLHKITGFPAYKEIAFDFLEKSKSRLLSENLEKVESFNQAGVSDEVKTLERNLKTEIGYLNDQLKKEKEKLLVDSQKISLINEKLFYINTKRDSLTGFLSQNYPKYFNIKYTDDNRTLSQVQSTLKNEQIVEYFWGDSTIYSLAISSKAVKFVQYSIDVDFLNNFNRYLSLLSKPDYRLGDSTLMYAHNLYQKLVAPGLIADNVDTKLIIIPDGPLAYLPFESLIKTYEAGITNFNNAQYLIRDLEVGYHYSTELLFDEDNKIQKSYDNLLAFSYSDENLDQGNAAMAGLKGSSLEIEALKSLMGGKFLKGEDATESKFKSLASNYKILHLAIHGAASKSDSIDAKLFFRESTGQSEDGILHPYELYNLNLNASLVVLSACETGVGKYKKGEGVFSMARGFAYAGCPAIVMSLWKVNDETTSAMMTSFYEHLNEGEEVNKSLRYAKIKYLEGSDEFTAHPSYWAAFVPIGKSQSIISTKNYLLWIVLGLLLPGLIFIITRNKKGLIQKN